MNKKIVLTGVAIGIFAILLKELGNPANMGLCIACFLRDIAGALGLHKAETVQYLRPEIIGIGLGAFLMSNKNREFKTMGGSAIIIRFLLGMFMMIGFLIFLGCPLRMILRLGGGDLNAMLGLAGWTAGIYIGVLFINKGFDLKPAKKMSNIFGFASPIFNLVLLLLLFLTPTFIYFSVKGPGSMRAPVVISLISGLIVGGLVQNSRFCLVGSIRNIFISNQWGMFLGYLAIFLTVLSGNLILGNFKLGFENQPIAHTDGSWNFGGMFVAGWCAVLLGGCPLKQITNSGQGNVDSSITVLGLLAGAGIAHSFGIAASPKGVMINGEIAIGVGLLFLSGVSWFYIKSAKNLALKRE